MTVPDPSKPGVMNLNLPVYCYRCEVSVYVPVEVTFLGPQMELHFSPDYVDVRAHIWGHEEREK